VANYLKAAATTATTTKYNSWFLPICQNQIQGLLKDFQGPYKDYIRKTELNQTGTFYADSRMLCTSWPWPSHMCVCVCVSVCHTVRLHHKKFELLTRHAKAYSSSCSQTPAISSQFISECVLQLKIAKIIKTPYFSSSPSFIVIVVDTTKKLVTSACCDRHHIHAYLIHANI